jgi:arginase
VSAKREIIILDAPSNLGLNPPEEGVVPGCYKLPWALRDHKLLEVLNAKDAGSVVPPRYKSQWVAGDGDLNAEAIATYSATLANRLEALIDPRRIVLVLGGECSILIGHMLALKRRGRYGLVYLDAHSDFRHPGNAEAIGAAGGEALAIVTGRGDDRLINLEQLQPYVQTEDIHVVGVRTNDDDLEELEALNIQVSDSEQLREVGAKLIGAKALETVTKFTNGFWIHLDLDVVDESEMSAVDCPEPNGPSFSVLGELLTQLLSSPSCVGMEVTIYDPDLDPSGLGAEKIVNCLERAFLNAQKTRT